MKRVGLGFIIPAIVRGRKPKSSKKATGLRALRKKNNGYYHYTHRGKVDGKDGTAKVTICVASKSYIHKKSGKRRTKKLLYAIWKVRQTPQAIRETYRTRFGIETSYRQMNEARIKTCTRDPALRLLFIGIALVLRNVCRTYSSTTRFYAPLARPTTRCVLGWGPGAPPPTPGCAAMNWIERGMPTVAG